MGGNSHVSVRSRKVAGELRAWREKAGLSTTQVGKKLDMSQSKVSRLETGASGLQPDDVSALLGLYQVPAAKRAELMDLVRKSEQRGWWERQPGLPHMWRTLIDLESKAARIQNFEPLVVPGLLQTAEYCRAVISGSEPTLSDKELDNLVASRMARQTVLIKRNAPQLLAVIDESALRRPVGEPGVMARQLRQLTDMAQRIHIRLQVVPISAGAYVGMSGPFMLLELAQDMPVVFVENHRTGLFLEEESDLIGYQLALRNILSVAHAPDASIDLITALAGERVKEMSTGVSDRSDRRAMAEKQP